MGVGLGVYPHLRIDDNDDDVGFGWNLVFFVLLQNSNIAIVFEKKMFQSQSSKMMIEIQ